MKSIVGMVAIEMNDIDALWLRRLDLNNMVALHTLLSTRSVSESARRLCLGQPAVSHLLKQLREQLQDPLLCRHGQGMMPTPFAEALLPELEAWLGAGERLFRQRQTELDKVERTVRLALPDPLEAALLPGLLKACREQAPGLSVDVAALSSAQALAALESAQIDYAVGYFPYPTPRLERQTLLRNGFACLYHRDQLQLPPEVGADEVAAWPHVYTSYTGEAVSLIDHYLQRHGLQRRILVRTASLLAIPPILAAVPALAVLPAAVCAIIGRHHAGIASARIDEPSLQLDVELLWHPRVNQDLVHQFVRAVLTGQCADGRLGAASGTAA